MIKFCARKDLVVRVRVGSYRRGRLWMESSFVT